MSKQVNHIIRCMNIEIYRISKIRHLLPPKITELLVNSLILSGLDYCNSLLASTPKYNMQRLQVAQNNAARLIFKKDKRQSAKPLLHELHWLPVEKRIVYKLCMFVFKALTAECPEYIKELLKIYVPTRNLRSSEDRSILIKPKIPRKIGEKSFLFSAPNFWNSLPRHVRSSGSLDQFKSQLKHHLFVQ